MLPNYLTQDRNTLETIARQHYQTVSLNNRSLLCRVLGKYLVYTDPEDTGVTPHLCLNGCWESWITLAMARVLERGWHCIDVGANQGYYTLLMADAVETEGRVLAIEPNPRLTELMNLSLNVNGFDRRATILQKAAADRDLRKVKLVIPRHLKMLASLCREATASDEVIEVETVTLDTLTEEWPRVDLIKIDAEGAEEAIWRGMQRTLARNPQITIILEICCARYTDPQAFVRQIQEAGFELRYIDFDGAIHPVSEERLLTEHVDEDWMLFLHS